MGYIITKDKILQEYGDVDFIQYGGQLLVTDEDREPWIEAIEPPWDGDHSPDPKWTVYRFEPERLRTVERDRRMYLVPWAWCEGWPYSVQQYDEWIHKYLEKIAAQSQDLTVGELREVVGREDPRDRAMVYIELGHYRGWYEFDQYPLELTEHEIRERYGLLADCGCPTCNKD